MFSFLRRTAAIATQPLEPAVSTATITSASLDKTTYAAGEAMTLTVVRSATVTTEHSGSITVGATGADGTTAASVSVSVTVDVETPQASTVAVADSDSREWSLLSDDGTTAVLTAIA